jgi:hypothetical protein
MLRFDGKKNAERREDVVDGGRIVDVDYLFYTYRKKVLTYATPIDEPFEVDTLEGVHTGKAGDYLAVGPHGEMYPIDQQVFLESYEDAEE